MVSVDGSTVHSSCQSTVLCVLIVRVWLNSAACVVCALCRQVRVTIVRVWLNSAVCVLCVCVCVVSESQGDHCQGVVELCSVCCVCMCHVGMSR